MATIIATGISTNKDPFEASKNCCLELKKQLGSHLPHIIFVFATIHFVNKRLLEAILEVFGKGVPIVGISGGGIISSNGILKYGVTMMGIYSTDIYFTQGYLNIDKNNYRVTGENLAHALTRKLAKANIHNREFGLFFFDGIIDKGSDILSGLKSILGRSFPILGASAADNMRFYQTFQFYNDQILSNSLVGVIFSGSCLCGYGIRHGWQPIGRPLTVTSSGGNVIKTIDNLAAVQIYQNYFEKSLKEIKENIARISFLYPLGIYLINEEEYLLRNILRIEDDGSLICQGDVAEGSQIHVMMGTKESALQSARQAAAQAKNTLRGDQILAAIIFESVSRTQLLGYRTNEEILTIRKILGNDVPFIGVCTFGEQAPLKSVEYQGESRFHNQTVLVITIGTRHVNISQ